MDESPNQFLPVCARNPKDIVLAAIIGHARRAERLVVELAAVESVNEAAVKYLNRLSDWFFVASRAANENGAKDVLWVPGKNQ